MKVVHISHEDHGGAGSAAYRLHGGLRSLGVDSSFLSMAAAHEEQHVQLIMPVDGGVETDGDIRRNQEFQQAVAAWQGLVDGYPNRVRGMEMFSSPLGVAPLLRQSIPEATDILHFHWVSGVVPFQAPQAWLEQYPIVWTLHDMNPFTGGCHFSFGCDKYMQGCGDCPQLGGVGEDDHSRSIHVQKMNSYESLDITCVSPSRWMCDRVVRSSLLGSRRQEVIHNGVDLDVFHRSEDARAREGVFSNDDFVLLFGTDSGGGRKGFEYLLNALRELVNQEGGERVKLAVFGKDPGITLCDIALPVTYLGYANDAARLVDIYSMADALILSSVEDNLPNVVTEAQACGLPVIAFGVGGVPEQIEHRETGYLARPKDFHDLHQGIHWAMERPDRVEVAETCRANAEARFNHLSRAREMMVLYESILARSSGKTLKRDA